MGVGNVEVHPKDTGLGVRRLPQGMIVVDIDRGILILATAVCCREQPFYSA
jgi:hypothetical protein